MPLSNIYKDSHAHIRVSFYSHHHPVHVEDEEKVSPRDREVHRQIHPNDEEMSPNFFLTNFYHIRQSLNTGYTHYENESCDHHKIMHFFTTIFTTSTYFSARFRLKKVQSIPQFEDVQSSNVVQKISIFYRLFMFRPFSDI